MPTNKKPLSNKKIFSEKPASLQKSRVKRFPVWLLVFVPYTVILVFMGWDRLGIGKNDEFIETPTYTCTIQPSQTKRIAVNKQLRTTEVDMQIHTVVYDIPQDRSESYRPCRKATLVEMTVKNVSDNEYYQTTSLPAIYIHVAEQKAYAWNNAYFIDSYVKRNNIRFINTKITSEQQRGWMVFDHDESIGNGNMQLIIPGDVVDGYAASADISYPSK